MKNQMEGEADEPQLRNARSGFQSVGASAKENETGLKKDPEKPLKNPRKSARGFSKDGKGIKVTLEGRKSKSGSASGFSVNFGG